MENRKDIGTYFKEQLGAMEVQPTVKVWEEIEKTLKQKRRKRFLLWVLLLVLIPTSSYLIYNFATNDSKETTPVNTGKTTPSAPNAAFEKNNTNTKKASEGSPIHDKQPMNTPPNGLEIVTDNKTNTDQSTTYRPERNTISESTIATQKQDSAEDYRKPTPSKEQKTPFPTTTQASNPKKKGRTNTNSNPDVTQQNKGYVQNKRNRDDLRIDLNDTASKTTNDSTLADIHTSNQKKKNNVLSKGVKNQNGAVLANSNQEESNLITEKLAATKTIGLAPKDSISRSSLEKPTTPELPKEEEKESAEEEEEEVAAKFLPGMWTVSIQAGPIRSGYLSNNYPLLNDNISATRAGDISLGYGLLLNVPIDDNYTIRFGFHNVQQRYTLTNLTSDINALDRFEILNLQNIQGFQNPLGADLINDINNGLAFNLQHKITYWELPLELMYNLKKDKLGVALIGGVDFYVFNDDRISVVIPNQGSFEIGSGNYFRKLSLGAHIGVGLRYQISKGVQFDVEPLFKYQFNSFKNGVNQLYPYYFGVYTGFTLKL